MDIDHSGDSLNHLVPRADGSIATEVTPPGVDRWEVRDSKIDGFFIRVTPGRISWYVRCRMGKNGQPKRRMGTWPALNSTAARKRAGIWLNWMHNGIDPLEEKKKHLKETAQASMRATRTLAVVFSEYIGRKEGKGAKSTSDDRKKVQWLSESPLWSMSIYEIDDAAVKETFEPLRLVAVGTPGASPPAWGPKSVGLATVRKIYAYVSAAYMVEALKLKILTSHVDGPFNRWRADINLPAPASKTRHLSVKSEAGQNWLAGLVDLQQRCANPEIYTTRASQSGHGIKPHLGALVDFYLCTLLWGGRKEETAKLQWVEVDLERNIVWFSADRTKSGYTGAAPLTPWAIEILAQRRALNALWRPNDPGPWVFPSRRHGKAIATPYGVTETLQKESGITITPHDLRRTVATDISASPLAKDAMAGLLAAGAALNHRTGRMGDTSAVTEAYIQEKMEAMRPIYQERENRLRKAAGLPLLVDETAVPDTSIEDLIARAKSDPAVKLRLMNVLLGG